MSGFENVVILFTLMTHIPLYWIILQRYSLLHLVKQSDSVKVFQPPYLYLLEEQLPQRAHTTDDVVLQMLAPVSLFVIEHSCSLSAVKPFFSLLPIEDRRLRKVRYLSEETVKNKKTTTKNTTNCPSLSPSHWRNQQNIRAKTMCWKPHMAKESLVESFAKVQCTNCQPYQEHVATEGIPQ